MSIERTSFPGNWGLKSIPAQLHLFDQSVALVLTTACIRRQWAAETQQAETGQKQSLIGDQAALVRGQLLGPKVSRKAGAIDRAGSPLALWSGGTDEVRW